MDGDAERDQFWSYQDKKEDGANVAFSDCDQMSSAGKRRPSDRNSSKHENSYSKLGGPMLTPKFRNFITTGSLLKEADDLKILS